MKRLGASEHSRSRFDERALLQASMLARQDLQAAAEFEETEEPSISLACR